MSNTSLDRYRFISGDGDVNHSNALNQAAQDGYKPILVSCDSNSGSEKRIIVLMEKER